MSTRNIIVALAIIAVIAIALNWKKLFNGAPPSGARARNGGEYPQPVNTPPVQQTIIVTAPLINVVQKMVEEVERETSNQRITLQGKYDLLNKKLASYGMWVAPDGTNPSSGNLSKCCVKQSYFSTPIGLDGYWSTNCNSVSARGSCN